MSKTLETMIVKNPSPAILAMLEKMKAYKAAQIKRMRSLNVYDYEIKVK